MVGAKSGNNGLSVVADGLRERGVVLRRGQVQGLLEMRNGFIQFPLSRQRDPQVKMGFDEIGSDLKRPLELLDGFRQPPCFAEHLA